MGRKKREWHEGASYHIMARGNRRSALFRDEDDCYIMLHLLKKTQTAVPFILHAYCLMTNHFHLEITTCKDPLWKIMKPFMQYYAVWFNRKYGYQGHLFESRYTSCLITDEKYFLEVSRYIHFNPVKAAMVREPLEYRYSSYRDYVSEDICMGADILDKTRILGAFLHHPREQYRMFVEGRISHTEQEMLIQKDMKEDDMWLPW